MERKVSQRITRRLAVVFTACLAVSLVFWGTPSQGYKTTSPEVVRMVDRAVDFLRGSSHTEPGGMALIGLTLLKNEGSQNDPKVDQAASAVVSSIPKADTEDIYSLGLSIIFLATYDHIHASSKYESEINTLLGVLQKRQKDHGGWGYESLTTGDTSMTQYGVLSLWEAKQVGVKIPQKVIDKVAVWLLKTQDPSGAWGYQGNPAKGFQLITQSPLHHSLAAAGLGSTYICADLLGMTPEQNENDGKPRALVEVKEEKKDKKEKISTTVNLELIRAAENRGDGWIQRNYTISPKHEPYYYMYALERYMSFRELAEGKRYAPEKVEGPKWYNDGVKYLEGAQTKKGSWDCKGQCGEVIDTALAALFLLRSSSKSIGVPKGYGGGDMIGGTGLPKEGEHLDPDGRVSSKPLLGSGQSLLEQLDRLSGENLDQLLDEAENLKGKKADQLLTSEVQNRFKKFLSDPSADKRLAGVRGLVKGGNFDNVPALILVLEKDPDNEVALVARDGLRRMTRRFDGFGLPDNHSFEERQRIAKKWKAWYLSLCPDTEF